MAQTAIAPAGVRERLLKEIAKVDRPGAVCTAGDLPLTMPGLEVDGVGTIRLPLGKTQARKLVGRCTQAPYGKGTDTVVDTDVRRVWEVDPERFALTNPGWVALIASIAADVQSALGLERKLTPHLYKLLVYEAGSFFLPHQDGEKLDGMVATLVVALPSPHLGGELIVTHEGGEHEVSFGGAASGHELSYAAFYADCQHEVRPLKDGYRLSLVYNLTLARSRKKSPVSAPRTRAVAASIGELFRHWPWSDDVQKIAVTLDHQYSQEGLRIDALKGVDRARADVLFDAAEQAGCVAHLALITHWQSGSAEGGDYGYRGYNSWSYDDEDGDDDEPTDYEMGEIYDDSLAVDHWSDRDGRKVALGEMDLDDEEIVSSRPREDWELGREEFEGYTGNAGMTLERWYHRAAVVVWPRANHYHVLCEAGTNAAIAGLDAMVRKLKRARKADREGERDSCLKFAAAIIDVWGPQKSQFDSYFSYSHRDRDEFDQTLFPRLLQELDAPDLLQRLLREIAVDDAKVEFDKSFPRFCKRHGWETFEDALAAVIDATTSATVARNAALLETLCLQRDKAADRIALCQRLADRFVAALEKIDAHPPKDDWRAPRIDRSGLLVSLVKSLVTVEADEPLDRLVGHALSRSKEYDLTDVHLKAIFSLETWLGRKLDRPVPAIAHWLADCRAELERRTAEPPAPPADFRRDDKLSCKCADCRELSRFLADPAESVHEFRRAKAARQHLHQVIDGNRCDLTHVTRRTGSPYTLVCTKTTASYEAACDVFARDQKNLTRLLAVAAKIEA